MAKRAKNTHSFRPDYAVPPGETLAEVLKSQNMDQTRLAALTGLSRKTINEIVGGKAAITPNTAIGLENVLGLPASFWTNLEANYQEAMARLGAQQRAEASIQQARGFPVKEMVDRGLLAARLRGTDLVEALLKAFGVADLGLLGARFEMAQPQFRASAMSGGPKPSLYAWLLEAEKKIPEGSGAQGRFAREALEKALPEIRRMVLRPLAESLPELQKLCAGCGVHVLYVPSYPGAGAHGATFWFRGLPVIVVGDLYRREDIFWFTFFHELHHVLCGQRKVYLEFGKASSTDTDEQEADKFASDTLINKDAWKSFCKAGSFSHGAIVAFAEQMGIHPGIVVGRLHHERHLPINHCTDLLQRIDQLPQAGPHR